MYTHISSVALVLLEYAPKTTEPVCFAVGHWSELSIFAALERAPRARLFLVRTVFADPANPCAAHMFVTLLIAVTNENDHEQAK